MTVNANDRRTSEAGNGTKTAYEYNYILLEETEMGVFLVTESTQTSARQTLGANYTVNAGDIGKANGGRFTMTVAPATGQTLVTHGETSVRQLFDPTLAQTYDPSAHMAALDRLTMIAQENRRDLGLALKYRVGSKNFNLTLNGGVPDPTVAGTFLEADAATNPPDFLWSTT